VKKREEKKVEIIPTYCVTSIQINSILLNFMNVLYQRESDAVKNVQQNDRQVYYLQVVLYAVYYLFFALLRFSTLSAHRADTRPRKWLSPRLY
jgi:hypothetical protein